MLIENTIFFGTIILAALTKLIAELAHHFMAVSIFAVFVIVCIILYLCKRKHKAFGVKDDEQQEEERVLEEMLRKTIFGEHPTSTATPEGTMALTVDEASAAVQFAKEEVLLGEGEESEPEASSSWWGYQ
jgi:hypothetical protein